MASEGHTVGGALEGGRMEEGDPRRWRLGCPSYLYSVGGCRREVTRRRAVLGSGGGWGALAVSASFSSVSTYSGSDSRFGLLGKEEEKPGVFCELLLQQNGGGRGEGQVQESQTYNLEGGLGYYVRSNCPCTTDTPPVSLVESNQQKYQ
jgi:hypothetical protein